MLRIFQKYPQAILLFLLLLSVGNHTALAQREIPPKPALQTSVYDEARMMSEAQRQQLEQKLINYADSTSTQIVVVTINSLEGEYIGTYSAEWAHQWGIGQSKKDNGVLLLIAKNDKKFWITTGYGLEPYLTDARTGTIGNQIIRPAFQEGNYYKGIDEATTAIIEVLEGKFTRDQPKEGFPIEAIIFLIFFILLIILIIRSNKNNHRGGPGSANWDFDPIILTRSGRSGGFGGGFGGGGFSGGGGFGGGFGGGGFGGGGAGGSW